MTRILRPVLVNKRLPKPEIPVLVQYQVSGLVELSLIYGHCDSTGHWNLYVHPQSDKTVVAWYEEIEIESLSPNEDKSYKAANAAADGLFHKTIMHQEGQTYFKNHILKELDK
jgi:hypothetical protein